MVSSKVKSDKRTHSEAGSSSFPSKKSTGYYITFLLRACLATVSVVIACFDRWCLLCMFLPMTLSVEDMYLRLFVVCVMEYNRLDLTQYKGGGNHFHRNHELTSKAATALVTCPEVHRWLPIPKSTTGYLSQSPPLVTYPKVHRWLPIPKSTTGYLSQSPPLVTYPKIHHWLPIPKSTAGYLSQSPPLVTYPKVHRWLPIPKSTSGYLSQSPPLVTYPKVHQLY